MLIDMIIPMTSFAALANYGKPLIGIICAGLWSVFRVIWESVKLKKVPLFSLITIIFVFVEFVTFYIAENLYWFSLGIRSGLYGGEYVGSGLSYFDRVEIPGVPEWCSHWPKSLEESGEFDWENEFNF
jgi:hypothetical protein